MRSLTYGDGTNPGSGWDAFGNLLNRTDSIRNYDENFCGVFPPAALRADRGDPTLGRFPTADPTIPDATGGQSDNWYSYVENEPLTRVDQTGLMDCDYATRIKDKERQTDARTGYGSNAYSVAQTGNPETVIVWGEIGDSNQTGEADCDGGCGGDETSGDVLSGDISGGGGPAQPVDQNKKNGQCYKTAGNTNAAANLSTSAQQAGFVTQAAGGGVVVVGFVVITASAITGQPEGIALGSEIVAFGNAGSGLDRT